MSHGVKISEAGSDIVKGRNTENTTPDHSMETLSYMISGIALPYLRGASVSLQRFNEASQKEKNIEFVYDCLHEASSLLEDLDTVDRYIIMCGEKHELHDKILNMRNHIRHDMRDNLTHESNDGRRKRAKKLGIDEHLIVSISFDVGTIYIGKTSLTSSEIVEFLIFADSVFSSLVENGIAKGKITQS